MAVVGIGIDVVDVADMRRTLERTPTFRERCFTPDERAYAEKQNDPTERYSVRFAAKEAVMKCMSLGLGAFGFHDCEVVVAESGAPSLILRGPALELAAERGITSWHITLSHTSTTATAMVIAERVEGTAAPSIALETNVPEPKVAVPISSQGEVASSTDRQTGSAEHSGTADVK